MDTLNYIINIIIVIYIAIPIITLIVIWFIRSSISAEGFNKIGEILKWYIVSVAIVLATQMVQSSFTERETGIKEMQVYEKYADNILKADNIEERWKLAEYFSSVTPTDRLRNRWIAYKQEISSDYNTYVELKKKEDKYSTKDSLTHQEAQDLNQIQNRIATFDKPLVNTVTSKGNWVVVFTGDTNLPQAKTELNNLVRANITNPRLVLRQNSYRAISQSFGTKADAQNYLNSNKNVIRSDAYVINLDSWCPNLVYNGDYYECQ